MREQMQTCNRRPRPMIGRLPVLAKFAPVCLISIVLTLDAYGQNPNLGTSGAQFLKIPAGARASAMAGAYIANANDATSLFWNPAGMVNVKGNDLSFSHVSLWTSLGLSHAAFVHSTEDLGSFGVSVTVLTMDKMEVTTEADPNGTGELFDAQDLMIGVSYARRLTEDFSVGITAKYVEQRIWNETASGVAFDIGTQYRIGFRDLTIAMSMMNFGGDLRYGGRDLRVKYDQNSQVSYNRLTPSDLATEDYPLPLHFQVGLSMTAVTMEDAKMLVAVDVTHPNDNDEHVNLGAEINVLDRLYLRGGYRFGYDTERATFGAGVQTPLGDGRVSFDYSYAVYNLLPDLNRFSLGISF